MCAVSSCNNVCQKKIPNQVEDSYSTDMLLHLTLCVGTHGLSGKTTSKDKAKVGHSLQSMHKIGTVHSYPFVW